MAAKGGSVAPTMVYLFDKKPLDRWDNTVDGIIAGFQKVAAG